MNDFSISYNIKGFTKYLSLTLSTCTAIFGFYLCIKEALVPNYSIIFFSSLIVICLSVILILNLTIWNPKPLITIDSTSLQVNIPNQNIVSIDWSEIKELGIGISHLTIKTSNLKSYNLDLGILKYNDLKRTKIKIIELCESKSIPFKND